MILPKIFKKRSSLLQENMKLRSQILNYTVSKEENEEITKKYITKLENDSQKLTVLEDYYKQCFELTKEKKELKKENALLISTCNSLNENIECLTKEVEKLKNKLKKYE